MGAMADLLRVGDETVVGYAADGVAVELCHAGEGDHGPFDPCAEDDRPLLRFYAAVADPETGDWTELDGCSACTLLTVDDDPVALVAAARGIHERLRLALGGGASMAATCERLSAIAASDARLLVAA